MTGLGALYARFDLAADSDGFNTGFAFPEFLVALWRLACAGQWPQANALYRRFLPLLVFEQQPGPAIRKEIWRRRGVLAAARVRAPGGQLDAWAGDALSALLAETVGTADITTPLAADGL